MAPGAWPTSTACGTRRARCRPQRSVHPKVAQSLMRHSDINLTMSRYNHVLIRQEPDAVAGLPDLSAPPAEAARDTGTAGPEAAAARLARCLALQGGKQVTSGDVGRRTNDEVPLAEIGRKEAEIGPFVNVGGEAGIRTQDQGLSPDNGSASNPRLAATLVPSKA